MIGTRTALLTLTGVSFLAVVLSLVTAHFGWNPCYLCITQRTIYAALAMGGLLGLAAPAELRQKWLLALNTWAVAGLGTAATQVYIQVNADKMACTSSGLNWLEDGVEWMASHLGAFFQVSGFCSDPYPIVGIPMAGWSMALFMGLGVVTVLPLLKKPG